MKKLSLKTQLNICLGFLWAGALFALMSRFWGQWCLWLGIAVLVTAALCRYSLIRCPHCGQPVLDIKTNPGKCPHCGGENQMEGKGIHLTCKACGKQWEMEV